MRTIVTRTLQALLSISAVVLLTGANDAGCGFGSGGGTAGGGGAAGGTSTGTGFVCPDGTVAQWNCYDAQEPTPCMGPDCATTSIGCAEPPPPPQCDCPAPPVCAPGEVCPPPPPCECPPMPGCVLECVPLPNICPAGFHSETVCTTPGEPPPVDPNDPSAPPPAMGSADDPGVPGDVTCSEVCVPDEVCPPGTVQQTVCSGEIPGDPGDPSMPPPPPPQDQCWNECVPLDPTCPPGSHEEAVCPPDPQMGAPCQIACVPDWPTCPPGSHEEAVCPPDPQMGAPCQIACVPDQPPCPPGQHLEQQCDDQTDPVTCEVSCVDDLPAN